VDQEFEVGGRSIIMKVWGFLIDPQSIFLIQVGRSVNKVEKGLTPPQISHYNEHWIYSMLFHRWPVIPSLETY